MNVSSVKNLNGETFSAVQDATLTDVVQSNSAQWGQGSEFPISADEAVQYVQTNSSTIDDTVTAFQTNSSTYMVEPNLEYNAVNEISAYNGSAIAQYGAEKQWLVHDDTIVHIANSAQYAFGCNVSALQRLMGIDETVLFEGNALHNHASATLSEPFTNFEKIKVYGHTDDGVMYPWYTEVPTFSGIGFIGVATNNAGWSKWFGLSIPDTTHIVPYTGYVATWASTTTGYLQNTWGITRVIGIGRKN